MEYGFSETPFGKIIVLKTAKGVRELQFADDVDGQTLQKTMARAGQGVTFRQDDNMARGVWTAFAEGREDQIRLDMQGTPFQQRVWAALRHVASGTTVSYSELARMTDMPQAVRSVASAVARNPIALLIPCHRVVHLDGSTGEYHWGRHRKRQLIEWERDRAAVKHI